jgi:hypothetical protein
MARPIRLILSAEDSAKAREILEAGSSSAESPGNGSVRSPRRPWCVAGAALSVIVVGGVALAYFRPEWFDWAPAVLDSVLAWISGLIARLQAMLPAL